MSKSIIDSCVELSEYPSNTFFYQWEDMNCRREMSKYISSAEGTLAYIETNQQYVETSMTQILDNYSSVFKFTSDKNSDFYNKFQYELLSSCLDHSLPGICDTFLTQFCRNYTREEVSNDDFLISLCGCYVPPDETYLQYTTGNSDCINGLPGCEACQGDGCFGQPSCDPLCHRTLTVQKSNKTIGSFITCPQNICVINIDNASVNRNKVSFINVCTGCQEGDGCLCIVDTPDDLQENIYSLCGDDSVYIVNGVVSEQPIIKQTTSIKLNYGVIFIVLLVLFAVIIYIIIGYTSKSNSNKSNSNKSNSNSNKSKSNKSNSNKSNNKSGSNKSNSNKSNSNKSNSNKSNSNKSKNSTIKK